MKGLSINFKESEYACETGCWDGGKNEIRKRQQAELDEENKSRSERNEKLSDRDRSENLVFFLNKLRNDKLLRHAFSISQIRKTGQCILCILFSEQGGLPSRVAKAVIYC